MLIVLMFRWLIVDLNLLFPAYLHNIPILNLSRYTGSIFFHLLKGARSLAKLNSIRITQPVTISLANSFTAKTSLAASILIDGFLVITGLGFPSATTSCKTCSFLAAFPIFRIF